ncbi:MAG: heavy metal-responsive transcriptional regulator [Anaerolineae bacterium]|nr:heavy metal-responsive transcriptional regulator [Anaerolineae bacterium]GIK38936.1 MAG: hypothetical protein BroJett011_27690 [Chloroflexota bacterium]
MPDHLYIKQVAQEVGISPPTLRYYEQIGLLPSPHRGDNGYRLYSPDDLASLRFVKRAKLLDLSLEEIRDIITYASGGRCESLREYLVSLLETKLAGVDERIRELNSLRADLEIYHQTLTGQAPLPVADSQPTDAGFCTCLDTPSDDRSEP